MNWKKIELKTPGPELPKIFNNNFIATKQYLDIFYDGSLGILIVPLETTGRVKSARGEFVTAIVDNLIVKKQFTNLLVNVTTADSDYYNTYIGVVENYRVADPSSFENQAFKYIDVNKPYYKIANDVSIAFLSNNLGQQIQLLFDTSTASDSFNILMDPSINGSYTTISIAAADASITWMTLIATEFDASWGTTWTIKQYGGNYNIN